MCDLSLLLLLTFLAWLLAVEGFKKWRGTGQVLFASGALVFLLAALAMPNTLILGLFILMWGSALRIYVGFKTRPPAQGLDPAKDSGPAIPNDDRQ